jgi:hypothetical protein
MGFSPLRAALSQSVAEWSYAWTHTLQPLPGTQQNHSAFGPTGYALPFVYAESSL